MSDDSELGKSLIKAVIQAPYGALIMVLRRYRDKVFELASQGYERLGRGVVPVVIPDKISPLLNPLVDDCLEFPGYWSRSQVGTEFLKRIPAQMMGYCAVQLPSMDRAIASYSPRSDIVFLVISTDSICLTVNMKGDRFETEKIILDMMERKVKAFFEVE